MPFRTAVRHATPSRELPLRRSEIGHTAADAPVAPLRVRPPRADRPRPERPVDGRPAGDAGASATTCRRSSSSRSCRRSSTAASSGRRSAPTAATRWPTTRRTVSIGRVIRLLDGALAPLPCVSLRYYGSCSCPDEATCALRDVMIDVRDAMLEILDNQSLADLAARPGRASIDPRGHPRRRAGRPPALKRRPRDRRGRALRRTDARPVMGDRQRSARRLSRSHDGGPHAQPLARDGLAPFVGFGRGLWLFPLDTMFRTVGLRYGWLKALFIVTPAPLLRAIGRLRAERAAWRATPPRPGLRPVPRASPGVDVAGAVPARHPAPPARDRQGVVRRPLRAAGALRRRRGPLPRHDDRRVERLDRHAVQLDPRPARARGRPSQHRLLRPLRVRDGAARHASTRSRWAPGRRAST